jgi:uncharacterized membrane protein
MALYIAALLIGVVAGLRTFTAPAALSWGAYLGALPLQNTPLAFLGSPVAAVILAGLAIAEYVADKLPVAPSRKIPASLAIRLVSGAVSGAAIGAAGGALVAGLVAGIIGAAVGTFGGYEARMRLAKVFGKDLPAALLEDFVAIAAAALLIAAARGA